MQGEFRVQEIQTSQHTQALIQASAYYVEQVAPWVNGAVIEAAHFYTDRVFGSEEMLSAKIGSQICDALTQLSIGPIVPMLFIDNLNVDANVTNHTSDNTATLAHSGFHPEVTIYEADMVAKAENILAQIIKRGQRHIEDTQTGKIHKKNTFVKIARGGIYLKKDFKELQKLDGSYTCALLDAAAYVEKFNMFGAVCVTVLPNNSFYSEQQKTTKAILKAAGYDIPILNVYFDQDGKLTFEYDF